MSATLVALLAAGTGITIDRVSTAVQKGFNAKLVDLHKLRTNPDYQETIIQRISKFAGNVGGCWGAHNEYTIEQDAYGTATLVGCRDCDWTCKPKEFGEGEAEASAASWLGSDEQRAIEKGPWWE